MSTGSENVEIEENEPNEEDSSEFAQLYQESIKSFRKGSLVKGRVLSVQSAAVFLDLGYKSDGVIPIEQFSPEEITRLRPGDELEVYLEESEDLRGNLILSREKAKKLQAWDDLNVAHEKGHAVKGRVVSKVKGGLTVDIGVQAFLPGSQIDLRPVRNLDSFIGQVIDVRIIKMNSGRGNIVLSRRALLEDAQKTQKEKTLSELSEGKVVQGVVKNITDYGVFVDLGGIDGLVHVSDLSWKRVGHPSEVCRPGDRIEAVVLKFDPEKQKISLGLKQRTQDPWLSAAEKYPAGRRVTGKVVSLAEYGSFVELEPGVEGLIHVSEMSWTQKVKHPSKLMKVGDMIEAEVLSVDPSGKRIALGTRQVGPNPWDTIAERYPVGSTIEGKVRTVTDFGGFVGLEEGIDGLIHISDLSWTKHIKNPADVLKKGQTTKAVVLGIDRSRQRVSLGIKQLSPDPWESLIPGRYSVGKDETVIVVRKTEFGLFVGLEHDIEGLIPASEIPKESTEIKEGDEVTARVLKVDRGDRKISLSIKAHVRGQDKDSLRDFMRSQQKPDTTIGALLKERQN